MSNRDSNTLFIIVGIIVLIAIIYYLNKNDDQPIPNQGTIDQTQYTNGNVFSLGRSYEGGEGETASSTISDGAFNLISSDHESSPFANFERKKRSDRRRRATLMDDEYDERDIIYKKNKFTVRTPEDIKDLYDIDKLLPQEEDEDGFEVLHSTKKIKGTHMLHPKIHMGANTVNGSKKNATHDIRGDEPVPKIRISPFNHSTIVNDNNLSGLCNSIYRNKYTKHLFD